MTAANSHVCKPGATVYFCPASNRIESDCHGGFDTCCDQPNRHRPVSTVLRSHIADAIRARIKRAAVSPAQPFDAVTAMLAPTERDLADVAITALVDHLDIGDAEAWCKTCRRVWDGPRHRCESDAEQRLSRIRDALALFNGRGVIREGHANFDVPTAGEVIAAVRAELDRPQEQPPAHDDGPSVAECAAADRNWDVQKEGE